VVHDAHRRAVSSRRRGPRLGLRRRGAALRSSLLSALLRSLTGPVSQDYGFDRGTPIDRPYIEAFLHEHCGDVRGHVLEVKDDTYARRFGGPRVTAVEVVDLDENNSRATLVADLDDGSLPSGRYDCVLLTQTLQFLDPGRALPALYRSLRPGGTLLITVSVLCRLETPTTDKWRLPAAGLQALLRQHLPDDAQFDVAARGNAVAAAAFALGLSVEDLGSAEFPDDWRFPIVTTARVVRPEVEGG
jgi:SAM-dependent methyltransferase